MSSSYGWTDEVILDLPLRRFRQVLVAIVERKHYEAVAERQLLAWQTRTIASFIAATVEVEKGKSNPLLAEAAKINLDDPGEQVADSPQEVENGNGSFERAMLLMGRGFSPPS